MKIFTHKKKSPHDVAISHGKDSEYIF